MFHLLLMKTQVILKQGKDYQNKVCFLIQFKPLFAVDFMQFFALFYNSMQFFCNSVHFCNSVQLLQFCSIFLFIAFFRIFLQFLQFFHFLQFFDENYVLELFREPPYSRPFRASSDNEAEPRSRVDPGYHRARQDYRSSVCSLLDTQGQGLSNFEFVELIEFDHNGVALLIEMKGITRCKLTIIFESAVCKKFLGQAGPMQPVYRFLIIIH
jgi:hypothetical protein